MQPSLNHLMWFMLPEIAHILWRLNFLCFHIFWGSFTLLLLVFHKFLEQKKHFKFNMDFVVYDYCIGPS